MPFAVLQDRGVIAVSGPDRVPFLQGLITNDLETLGQGNARYAALLTPQGKILFDFLIVSVGEALFLDCSRQYVPALTKRLALYKLRAQVAIEDVSQQWQIGWHAGDARGPGFPDPRSPLLGTRAVLAADEAGKLAPAEAYEMTRVAAGVPECGKDYASGEVLAHDAGLDLLNGIDFKKGCYVGQEVVSRMHHRGTARTRPVCVTGEADLPSDRPDLKAGDFPVGKLGSVQGRTGVALVRLDRVGEALAAGQAIEAGGIPVRVTVPSWAPYAIHG
jgi:folate-binding protein YgfZ